MKEKKSFFTENNHLNKGYSTENRNTNTAPKAQSSGFNIDLPNGNILAEYEEMQPGVLKQMLDLTSKEQEHRHNIEIITLKMQKTALRMGRLFAIFAVIAICYTTSMMAINNLQQEAMIFAAIGFTAIALSSFNGRVRNYNCSKTDMSKPQSKNNAHNIDHNTNKPKYNSNNNYNSSHKTHSNFNRRRKRS